MASILQFRVPERRNTAAVVDRAAEIIVFPRVKVWEIFGTPAEPAAAAAGGDAPPSATDLH